MTTECPKTTKTPPLTLYVVLRDGGLNNLHTRSTDELKAYKALLQDRINFINNKLMTQNLFRNHCIQLGEDIRWYEKILGEISVLLTREFHDK